MLFDNQPNSAFQPVPVTEESKETIIEQLKVAADRSAAYWDGVRKEIERLNAAVRLRTAA